MKHTEPFQLYVSYFRPIDDNLTIYHTILNLDPEEVYDACGDKLRVDYLKTKILQNCSENVEDLDSVTIIAWSRMRWF